MNRARSARDASVAGLRWDLGSGRVRFLWTGRTRRLFDCVWSREGLRQTAATTELYYEDSAHSDPDGWRRLGTVSGTTQAMQGWPGGVHLSARQAGGHVVANIV